jgi:hypothetical protein
MECHGGMIVTGKTEELEKNIATLSASKTTWTENQGYLLLKMSLQHTFLDCFPC